MACHGDVPNSRRHASDFRNIISLISYRCDVEKAQLLGTMCWIARMNRARATLGAEAERGGIGDGGLASSREDCQSAHGRTWLEPTRTHRTLACFEGHRQ